MIKRSKVIKTIISNDYSKAGDSKYVKVRDYNALKEDFDDFVFKDDIVDASSATLGLTAKDSGKTIVLNRAAGVTVSLPISAVGLRFKFLVSTSVTSNAYTINTNNTTDLFTGGVIIIDSTTPEAPDMFSPDLSNDDSMAMDGSTTGGLVGTAFEIICTAPYRWFVTGTLNGSGTLATPFS